MTGQQRRARQGIWLVEADPKRQTAASGVNLPNIGGSTDQTLSTVSMTEVDNLRGTAKAVSHRIEHVHHDIYVKDWQLRAQQRAETSAKSLLDDLADLGFAWRDIARLIGVSVPAIQKWRKGGPTTPMNRQRLARLLAGCDLIIRHRAVADIGQWFEMSLVPGVPLTPLDLWASGEYSLVFEYALEYHDAEFILTRFQPGWRERYASDFETFVAGDGQLSIRLRER